MFARLPHPGPRRHDTGIRDIDELRQFFTGIGIVLLRRHNDASVARPDADDPPIAKGAEEAAEYRPDAARIRVFERVWSGQGVAGVCHRCIDPLTIQS